MRVATRTAIVVIVILLLGRFCWMYATGFSWYLRTGAALWSGDDGNDEKRWVGADVVIETSANHSHSHAEGRKKSPAEPHTVPPGTVHARPSGRSARVAARCEVISEGVRVNGRLNELEAEISALVSAVADSRLERDQAQQRAADSQTELAALRSALSEATTALASRTCSVQRLESIESSLLAQLAVRDRQLETVGAELSRQRDEWMARAATRNAQIASAEREIEHVRAALRQEREDAGRALAAVKSENASLRSSVEQLSIDLRQCDGQIRKAAHARAVMLANKDRECAAERRRLQAAYWACQREQNAIERRSMLIQADNKNLRMQVLTLRDSLERRSAECRGLVKRLAQADALPCACDLQRTDRGASAYRTVIYDRRGLQRSPAGFRWSQPYQRPRQAHVRRMSTRTYYRTDHTN